MRRNMEADIIVKQKDHSNLKILAEIGICKEIQEYFSFMVPNAKFHPKFKLGYWDGKIYLFSIYTKEIYVGLLEKLRVFAKDNSYTLDDSQLFPDDQTISNVTPTQIRDFCESLNVMSRGEKIEIYDYQIDAVYRAIKDKRKVLLSPTSSGKSLIIYCILRYYLTHGLKALIIVPRVDLVNQLYENFEEYSEANGWNVTENCYRVFSGKEKISSLPVVISTWQSIIKNDAEYFSSFSLIIGDEAHHFKAKSLTDIMVKCINAPYRIGTTGTLDDTEISELVLIGLFGDVYQVITTKKLMEDNKVSDLHIDCIVLQYSDHVKKPLHYSDKDNKRKKLDYQDELDFLLSNEKRNKFIRNLAINCKQNTLVLFQIVEHGKTLFQMIKEKVKSGRQVFFVFGGVDSEDREIIRKAMELEKDAIIVASYGTFSTGINIPNLHNIIFASPSKSRVRNLQSIGRGLRLHSSKSTCKLYDIGDDLTLNKSRKNHTLEHMIVRVKLYSEQGFEFKLHKVPLQYDNSKQ